MRVGVIVPPAAAVVTVDQVKDHLNIDHGDDDALLQTYLSAAVAQLDGPSGWLGRALGVQTIEIRLDAFDAGPILLPCPPIIDVLSVQYLDGAGAVQTMPAGDYELLGAELDRAYGKSWPAARSHREAVRVRYRAGYEGPIDPRIHAAILLMVGDLYANRETIVTGTIATALPMSMTVENLLTPLRVWA
jgi:uncharacterized phiE125 gp8 family phage protein